MKRLLAYLFLVLSLGLVFNVYGNAATTLCKKINFSYNDIVQPVFYTKENNCNEYSIKITIEEYVDILLDWNLKQKTNIFWSKDLTINLLKSIRREFIENKLNTNYLDDQLVKKFEGITGVFSYVVALPGKNEIQTSKRMGSQKPLSKETISSLFEPSQTQKVVALAGSICYNSRKKLKLQKLKTKNIKK